MRGGGGRAWAVTVHVCRVPGLEGPWWTWRATNTVTGAEVQSPRWRETPGEVLAAVCSMFPAATVTVDE